MANEINWIRERATKYSTTTMIVSPEEAKDVEIQPGAYRVENFSFVGTLSFRMAKALSGVKLINTDTEHETLRLGTGYRGGEGKCEYYRTVYTFLGLNPTSP